MADLIAELYYSFYNEEFIFWQGSVPSVWKVPKRYKNLKPFHHMFFFKTFPYSETCSATDSLTGKELVIMKVTKLEADTAYVGYFKLLCKQLALSRFLKHENLIELLDIFTGNEMLGLDPGGLDHEFSSLYLVYPKMGDCRLSNIIAAKNSIKSITDDHVQCLIYQLLCGLKYIHSAGITSADLKPEYLWVNESCELKIEVNMTTHEDLDDEYVAGGRWYRAPEICFRWIDKFGPACDIWSIGCIMAELLTTKILFLSRDHLDHLKQIITLLGVPSNDFIDSLNKEYTKTYITSNFTDIKGIAFSQFFAKFSEVDINPQAIDLLEKLIKINPDERITANDALLHPYFSLYHDAEDEIVCANLFDMSLVNMDLTKQQWREQLLTEVVTLQKKLRNELENEHIIDRLTSPCA